MPEDIGKVLSTLTSKSDTALFLAAFAAGFAIDLLGWMGGIPSVDPITAGVGLGTSALATKKAIEAVIGSSKRLRALQQIKHITKDPDLRETIIRTEEIWDSLTAEQQTAAVESAQTCFLNEHQISISRTRFKPGSLSAAALKRGPDES
jgi:hypothetical protein